MRILLTNDDGWDAKGLSILKDVVEKLGEVWIVAPAVPMSGISHQITFEKPMKLEERGPKVFSLTGTPADCVRIGTTQLDLEFDWVLSGINNGANLGADIYVSGTFAATREAVLRGCRSIALSQHRRKFKAEFDWTNTREMAAEVLGSMLSQANSRSPGTAINVNFPDKHHLLDGDSGALNEVKSVECPLDQNPLPADFEIDPEGEFVYCSNYDQRPRSPGKDIDVCFGGHISVSYLKLGG